MISQDGASPLATPLHLSREQIMLATAACLREYGYDNTTIRRIASRLDCAVGSIYRYFIDKRELLFAVTQEAFEPVAKLAESGSAGVDASALAYYRQAASDPPSYRLMFWLASVGAEVGRKGAAAEGGRIASVLPPVVARIVRSWETALGDCGHAQRYWAMLHGAIMLGLNEAQILATVGTTAPRPGSRIGDPSLSLPPVPPLSAAGAVLRPGEDAAASANSLPAVSAPERRGPGADLPPADRPANDSIVR